MRNDIDSRVAAFISIPRNASNAVRVSLGLGPNRDHDSTGSPVIYENHQRGSVLTRKYDLGRLFVFCFVRNPYERCVSWYQYHRDRGMEPYTALSFDAWVRQGLPHHWQIQNETDYSSAGLSPLSQYDFIEGTVVDYVGRIESFEDDIRLISATVAARCADKGIDYQPRQIVHSNRSSRPEDWRSLFQPETLELVSTLLERDFSTFGYSTDPDK